MRMLLLIIFMAVLWSNCSSENKTIPIDSVMKIAQQQYNALLVEIDGKKLLPRTIEKGELKLVEPEDWTSGFFPGALWYLYQYSGDEKWKAAAEKYSSLLEDIQYFTGNHDIGFMMYCSYGNGYRITKNKQYRELLIQSAKSLCTRYNPKVGCIRSWDWNQKKWQYPVIIDNMMNLELLLWAFHETGDSSFFKIAVAHADNTMKNHFREDFSTYHVVDYDPKTGQPRIKQTWQGLSDSSAWARGQAWGLYGFTMMYRETGNLKYLKLAEKIAEFILKHIPHDMVPYWDFDVDSDSEPRDASAAAIMASAFFDLSKYGSESSGKYLNAAIKILQSLSSEKYLAKPGENNHFILMHSVGSKPGQSEIDVPLNYADYYYMEALLKASRRMQ
ncbi:MAG: glycoside hydrolase family 88 protein [Candidatus Marinimicrobia bacterium]|nr:glycoside hydrolase family 88 protein [Candidatus Neomarinimicrobiota bacterium]